MKKYFVLAGIIGFLMLISPFISHAEEVSSSEVLKRLSEIEQNQVKIIQSLEEVKSELQIVKVRVTSR